MKRFTILMMVLIFALAYSGTAMAVDARNSESEVTFYKWECESGCGTIIYTLTTFGYYLAKDKAKGSSTLTPEFYNKLGDQFKKVRRVGGGLDLPPCGKNPGNIKFHFFYISDTRKMTPDTFFTGGLKLYFVDL